jgi:hypothetical protein
MISFMPLETFVISVLINLGINDDLYILYQKELDININE